MFSLEKVVPADIMGNKQDPKAMGKAKGYWEGGGRLTVRPASCRA